MNQDDIDVNIKINNCYPIENTLCLHEEQFTGAYMNKNYWKTFQKDMKNFKRLLRECRDEKKSLMILRLGHSEFTLYNHIIPINKKVSKDNEDYRFLKGTFYGEKRVSSIEDYNKFYKSLNESDIITTQMGDDFLKWMNKLRNYNKEYNKYLLMGKTGDILKNPELFLENEIEYPVNKLINFPLDIIYGLMANGWILNEFKNEIGLIGNKQKLNIIKKLLNHSKYREYINNDYFTDYIGVDHKNTITQDHLEGYIYRRVKKSKCKIFLIGIGFTKLKIFHKLKKIRNDCVYLDVGCGIDALAGMIDIRRPYCGNWRNFRLKDENYKGIHQIDWKYGLKLPRNNNQVFL